MKLATASCLGDDMVMRPSFDVITSLEPAMLRLPGPYALGMSLSRTDTGLLFFSRPLVIHTAKCSIFRFLTSSQVAWALQCGTISTYASSPFGSYLVILSLQAVGWLALFLPPRQIAQQPSTGDWEAWVREILRVWQAVAPCEWFHCQALGLLARVAKHDRYGGASIACIHAQGVARVHLPCSMQCEEFRCWIVRSPVHRFMFMCAVTYATN